MKVDSYGPEDGEMAGSNHAVNGFRELQVTERTQAIVRARDAGIGGEPRA